MSANYLVEAERDGKWWMIRVDELGILTQARRSIDVERNAREAIAVTLDVPANSFEVALAS
jgi:predicted RNase H-like HicB family nuclease